MQDDVTEGEQESHGGVKGSGISAIRKRRYPHSSDGSDGVAVGREEGQAEDHCGFPAGM